MYDLTYTNCDKKLKKKYPELIFEQYLFIYLFILFIHTNRNFNVQITHKIQRTHENTPQAGNYIIMHDKTKFVNAIF